jgi:hypothetical protein
VARDLKPPVLYRAAELFRDGHTVRQVADLLGVSRFEAGRLRLKAVAEGIVGAMGTMRARRSKRLWEGVFGSIRRVPMSRGLGHGGLGQRRWPPCSRPWRRLEAQKSRDRTKAGIGPGKGLRIDRHTTAKYRG